MSYMQTDLCVGQNTTKQKTACPLGLRPVLARISA